MIERPNDQSVDRTRANRLIRWFASAARDLPWRRNRSSYNALVSELMLQQTQVARVVERYEEFVRQFPNPDVLARADEQDVLAAWQGLGYYRRARMLHQAAKQIMTGHGGEIPSDAETLRQLPGVGRYTAGAIASIVGNAREPVVDGNVKRVLARWHAEPDPCEEWCWDKAKLLVESTSQPGRLNEAMMELGATVCTPSQPSCDLCPVRTSCEANQRGCVSEIPVRKPAVRKKIVHHHCVLIERAGSLLLEQRPERGLWAYMWQPVTVESEVMLDDAQLVEGLGFGVSRLCLADVFTHQTTHRRVEFRVYTAKARIRRGDWQPLRAIKSLPMSNPHRRMIANERYRSAG